MKCCSFRVIFHEFGFETSSLEFEVSKSSIGKHTTSCDEGNFSSFIVVSQPRRPIEFKFSQVCYWDHGAIPFYSYMLRYTKLEDWFLTTKSVHCLNKSILEMRSTSQPNAVCIDTFFLHKSWGVSWISIVSSVFNDFF